MRISDWSSDVCSSDLVVEAVDEGADELALVKQVQRLRRRIDVLDVAGVEFVGRQELGNDDGEIHGEQESARPDGNAVAAEPPPHNPPLCRLVIAFLLRRQLFDRVGVERPLLHVVRQPLARHQIAVAHLVAPPPRRMRGSSIASSTSETKTPITTSTASNIRKAPARYMSWLCSERSNSGPFVGRRSEERRVGREGVSTVRT